MGHEGRERQLVDFSALIDTSKLADQTVLITGGASGIGAQTVLAFAEQKAHVTIADVNERLGQELVQQLAGQGLSINFVKTDVTSWESQVNAFKSAIDFGGHGSINVVCAIAGVGGVPFIMPDEQLASLEKDPPEPPLADVVYNVNAKGAYFTSKLAQHYFGLGEQLPIRNRSLILMSSLGGYFEFNNAEYCSSKWAVRGIFRAIRSMMEDLGYRTNLIAPCIMDTPASNYFAKLCRARGIPVGDVGNVVNAVVRCAADESINGRALAIGAEKSFDLEDDLIGFNSGKVMAEYHQVAEAKDLMDWQKQRP